MKKIIYVVLMAVAAVMLGSCGQKTAQGSGSSDSTAMLTNEAAEELDTLTTDTISFSKVDGIYEVALAADYPVAGGDSLVKKVRAFINDYLGGAYEGSLDDGQAMIKRNGEYTYGELMERCGDVDPEEVNGLFLYKMVNKVCETNTYVTFLATTSEYTGGLHGIGFTSGHTFSKVDGRMFGYEMMKDTDSKAFNALIKHGLKTFFSKEGEDPEAMSDQDLLNELVSYGGPIDELPLPETEPYLTEKGVTFIYQPYEISYYAAGKPEFTIPFEAAKPFLTTQGLSYLTRLR